LWKRELFRIIIVIIYKRRWRKVNNCAEHIELLSAYADKELTESDIRRIEDHLSVCENCSALLEIYRGISTTAVESAEPAPEELCSNVMEAVMNEEAQPIDDSGKRRKLMRIVFTRYVPIAACLAVTLLALPYITNYLNIGYPSADIATEAVMTTRFGEEYGQAGDDNYSDAIRDAADMAGGATAGGGATASGGTVPAPAGAPPSSEDTHNRVPQLSVTDNDNNDAGASLEGSTSESFESTEDPADTTAPTDPAEPADPAPPTDTGGGESTEPPDIGGAPSEPPDSQFTLPEGLDPGIELDPADIATLMGLIRDVYAWITIAGELPEHPMQPRMELPELLASRGFIVPEELIERGMALLNTWTEWEMVFALPRAEAMELIEEIRGRTGVVIEVMNASSEFAMVLYRSGT
jgi:hypothetical protein